VVGYSLFLLAESDSFAASPTTLLALLLETR
jgi:hypothetical protein